MPLLGLGAAVFFVTTGAYTLYKRMSLSDLVITCLMQINSGQMEA